MARTEAAATGERTRPRRGRPRSPEADQAILDASLELLAEVGYAGFTVGEVIARAGVSSATLYRRWASKHDLVTAALASLGPDPVSIDTGSFEGDLAAFVDYLGAALSRRDDLAGAWSIGRRDPELRRAILATFVEPRRALLAEILERAHERKALASVPPIEDCWSFVSGPIHHRVYIRGVAFSPSFSRAVTTLLAAGLRALAAR